VFSCMARRWLSFDPYNLPARLGFQRESAIEAPVIVVP
jgi:hypothetical protein